MKKLNDILTSIFAIGILCTLLTGILTFIGYIVALIIGGNTATEMCYTILKEVLPWAIRITSVFVGIGLITMYISKQSALTFVTNEETKKGKKKKTKKSKKK